MITKEKQKAQVKSKFYYIFWGLATASVFVGQMYVGSGYRQMSKAFNRIIDTTIEIMEPKGYYRPIVPPPTGNFGRDQLDLSELDPDDYIIWLEK